MNLQIPNYLRETMLALSPALHFHPPRENAYTADEARKRFQNVKRRNDNVQHGGYPIPTGSGK